MIAHCGKGNSSGFYFIRPSNGTIHGKFQQIVDSRHAYSLNMNYICLNLFSLKRHNPSPHLYDQALYILQNAKAKTIRIQTRYFNPALEEQKARDFQRGKITGSNESEVDAIKRRMHLQFENRRERGHRPGRTAGRLRIALILAALTILTLIILK